DSTQIEAVFATGIEFLRQRGYFISAFPEGDGATFDRSGERDPYNPQQAVEDFEKAFPRFAITVPSSQEVPEALASLNQDQTIACTALVPVEHLLLHRRIALPAFR